MSLLTVQELVRATHGALIGGDLGVPVTGVSIDSRSLAVGEAFFAIRGDRLDGHAYVRDAAARGASCLVVHALPDEIPLDVPVILVDDTTRALGRLAAFHHSRFSLPVVAVTGSNGKTTTKEMIAAILAGLGPGLKAGGRWGCFWGALGENLTNHRPVVEGEHVLADDLVGFVALAGDEEKVARAGPIECGSDGGVPVRHHSTALQVGPHSADAGDDLLDDGRWILAPRVVRGHPQPVGEPRGDPAHDGALPPIPVAAAAEDDAQAAAGELSRGREHALQGVGSMGVVHHDEKRLPRPHPL